VAVLRFNKCCIDYWDLNTPVTNKHNICVIFLVMLTNIVRIDLVGFLEISYPITSMTCIVMEVFEGEQLSNIPVFDFEYITMKGGMSVIKVSCSQLDWFNRSNV
jgi:hypothetical protein